MTLGNIKRFSFLLSVILIVLNPGVCGQKLSIETVIDTNRILLGDQIELNYVINKKDGIAIDLPKFSDTLTDGIEILGEPAIDSERIDRENWKIRMELLITSFDTGIYYIPPQPVVFRDESYSDTLYSRPTYLEVLGVKIDTTNTVRDIKGPEAVPVTFLEIVTYVLPVLLVAILVYLVVLYFIRRKKKKPLFKPARPEEPADITALRELDKIKAQKLWQQNKVKEYYTRITYIVRWYIEKRFEIPALEQISTEILEDLKRQKLDDIDFTNLDQLLNLADMVKFAKGIPDPDENITHLDNAYSFIKKTRSRTNDIHNDGSNKA